VSEKRFFKSKEEFFDLLDKVREARKKGAYRIVVHGSMVGDKGPQHRDVDLYIEYLPKRAKEIGCYDLGALDFMRVERGKRSGASFDIRETNVPFEISSVGGWGEEDKPKRVIFGPKSRRTHWE